MALALKEVPECLPQRRRAEIDQRYAELVDEVESLKELRKLSELSQAKLADLLNISQPAISKIEKQTDMYLSTLRNYVEAIGGELEIVIRLPKHAPLKIKSLEDVLSS